MSYFVVMLLAIVILRAVRATLGARAESKDLENRSFIMLRKGVLATYPAFDFQLPNYQITKLPNSSNLPILAVGGQ